MDRLIIESILGDVNEILLSAASACEEPETALVLVYKTDHKDKVIHAWSVLKDIADKHEIDLAVCKTMVAGIYDLEIKTPALDEPLRIMNKAISHETIGAIEDLVNQKAQINLTTNVSERASWISVSGAHIKECAVKH